jgi:NAD(P)-dependent dehydrogenase (short-subunit alcohol dehydrogenase family)
MKSFGDAGMNEMDTVAITGSALLKGQRCLVMAGDDGIGDAITSRFRDEGALVFQTGCAGGTEGFSRVEDVAASFKAARAAVGELSLAVLAYSHWAVLSPEKWSVERFQELGALCFISTDWALAASPDLGLMGASKAPLGVITKALALQGAKRRLRVNTIFMCLVDSPKLRALAQQRGSEAGIPGELFERLAARVPLGRPGMPDEIAKAAAFISSPRLNHVTGVSVLVDGGLLYA